MALGEVAEIADGLGELDLHARERIASVVERVGVRVARVLADRACEFSGYLPGSLPEGIHASSPSGLFLQLAAAELSVEGSSNYHDEDTIPDVSALIGAGPVCPREGGVALAKGPVKAVREPPQAPQRGTQGEDSSDDTDRAARLGQRSGH
jgi:hypothetical protein